MVLACSKFPVDFRDFWYIYRGRKGQQGKASADSGRCEANRLLVKLVSVRLFIEMNFFGRF